MKLFTEVFNCRYPIVALAMNKVSNLALACAVRKAGAVPSISVFNYVNPPKFDIEQFRQDIEHYCRQFGDGNIIISLDSKMLAQPDILKVIVSNNIKAVEYLHEPSVSDDVRDSCKLALKALKNSGTLIFFKLLLGNEINNATLLHFDGIIFKGAEGAGRVNQNSITLEQALEKYLVDLPGKILIPSGGIGTGTQVKDYIDCGASAVGVGTLFAACQESPISAKTKQAMIKATHNNINPIERSSQLGIECQNALVFSKFDKDDDNNTKGLIAGIKNPTQGHVFAGHAIDNVTEILPAHTIVQRLADNLV